MYKKTNDNDVVAKNTESDVNDDSKDDDILFVNTINIANKIDYQNPDIRVSTTVVFEIFFVKLLRFGEIIALIFYR